MNSARHILTFAVSASLAAALPAQHQIRATLGDQHNSGFGARLQTIPDIDGDGTTDLIIGEPARDAGGVTDAGAATLFRVGAWSARFRTVGSSIQMQLGRTVAALGDVNGDTIPDWACGSGLTLANLGIVRVLSGANGFVLHELIGEPASEFGSSICGIGDRDGDGRADLAVGSPSNSLLTPNGTVALFSGANGTRLALLAGGNGTGFGRTLLTLGDTTGDGNPEFVIGEPLFDTTVTDNGRLLLKNPRDGVSNSWVWQNTQNVFQSSLGAGQLAVVGDVTGDGRPDFAASLTGRVVVCNGATGAILHAIVNPEFGAHPAVAGVGDWNGDGTLDLAVGAPLANGLSGRVLVYSLGSSTPLLSAIDGPQLSGFGSAIAGVGDLDGDGRAEIAIGAPSYQSGGLNVGRVSLHSFDIQPATTTFGVGCPGSVGTPSLFFSGAPNLGETFAMQCSNLRQNGFGFWLLSFSSTTLGSFSLPLDLTPFGLPCTLLVSADAPETLATTNTTTVTRTFLLPSTPSLATFQFHAQVAMIDAAAVGGMAFSNGGTIRIGNL